MRRPSGPSHSVAPLPDVRSQEHFEADSVDIPDGIAPIGTDTPCIPLDGEDPLRRRRIKPFRLGKTCVANQSFANVVQAADYQTEAERFGWYFVFWSQVLDHLKTKSIPRLE